MIHALIVALGAAVDLAALDPMEALTAEVAAISPRSAEDRAELSRIVKSRETIYFSHRPLMELMARTEGALLVPLEELLRDPDEAIRGQASVVLFEFAGRLSGQGERELAGLLALRSLRHECGGLLTQAIHTALVISPRASEGTQRAVEVELERIMQLRDGDRSLLAAHALTKFGRGDLVPEDIRSRLGYSHCR